eukprot:scpid94568/ scgid18871/ 
MAAPRKFAEKIALLQQKDREQTEQYDRLIHEVSATKMGAPAMPLAHAHGMYPTPDFHRGNRMAHSSPNLHQYPSTAAGGPALFSDYYALERGGYVDGSGQLLHDTSHSHGGGGGFGHYQMQNQLHCSSATELAGAATSLSNNMYRAASESPASSSQAAYHYNSHQHHQHLQQQQQQQQLLAQQAHGRKSSAPPVMGARHPYMESTAQQQLQQQSGIHPVIPNHVMANSQQGSPRRNVSNSDSDLRTPPPLQPGHTLASAGNDSSHRHHAATAAAQLQHEHTLLGDNATTGGGVPSSASHGMAAAGSGLRSAGHGASQTAAWMHGSQPAAGVGGGGGGQALSESNRLALAKAGSLPNLNEQQQQQQQGAFPFINPLPAYSDGHAATGHRGGGGGGSGAAMAMITGSDGHLVSVERHAGDNMMSSLTTRGSAVAVASNSHTTAVSGGAGAAGAGAKQGDTMNRVHPLLPGSSQSLTNIHQRRTSSSGGGSGLPASSMPPAIGTAA